MEVLIVILLIAILAIGIVLLVKLNKASQADPNEEVFRLFDQLMNATDNDRKEIIKEIWETRTKNSDSLNKTLLDRFSIITKTIEERLDSNQKTVNESITRGLKVIQDSTNQRLTNIQADINTKLDKSLNERLDSSFKAVGDRLEQLYQSLGELKNLESGVSNLNRTLSNVKSRGVFGEMALGNILADILTPAQYAQNVSTKNNGDVVEYAIKIPDKEDKGFIWLPIDSKFPTDIYEKIVSASENADPAMLAAATQEMKQRIRLEATSIHDKYINPPTTTDFAIMFLPTESLYSTVLQIPGLAEEVQQKRKVIICGPTTLTALVNSLSVGFRFLTVNKKSEEILKVLGAFKTQFGKFDELVTGVQKSLNAAQNKTAELADRSRLVKSKLNKVETISLEESNAMLEITGSLDPDGIYAEA